MVLRTVHRVMRTACFPAPRRASTDPRPSEKTRFIADFVARHAWREAVAGSPCATPCPARPPGRKAPGFPEDVGNGRRMEARQGAIRTILWNTFPAAAPRSPPFRLHPMCDPANRPLARTSAGTPPAFARAQPSPDRASGVRGGRLQCACGRTPALSQDEDGGIGISRKTRMAPCRASIPLPFPTHPHTRGATPARRRALTPFHCIAGHRAPGERDAQLHPIRDEPKTRMALCRRPSSFSSRPPAPASSTISIPSACRQDDPHPEAGGNGTRKLC
jgi:hypothetical protein